MADLITIEDVPALFDQYGQFVPVAEAILDQLPDQVVSAYQRVAEAFSVSAVAEQKLQAAEKKLRACVQELHAARSALSEHRVDAVSETKKWIESQRKFG